jgi:cytochrome c biogenesis protein CcdA
MLAATALVAAFGLADSLNPVTILVAVYLGSGTDPVHRLGGFIVGVFAVYLLGGLVLMLGPAELLRHALAGVEIPGADAAALVAGAVLIGLAVAVWTRRRGLARVRPPDALVKPGSALFLGAVVTVLDLPTAFPYFGAIGVIVSADVPAAAQLILLTMFNLLYVLPLALVLVAHLVFGARSDALLTRVRGAVQTIAAPLLAASAGIVGVALVARGAGALL